MRSAGFVTDEDVTDFLMLKERVINRQNCAAGIPEYGVHTLFDQGIDQNFCAGFFGHCKVLTHYQTALCCSATE
jgi:hypothetical protein